MHDSGRPERYRRSRARKSLNDHRSDADELHERFRRIEEVIPMSDRYVRLDDDQAHERALAHLAAAVGGPECTERVCWDPDHHLQGHVEIGGEHLVLIAPRDDAHQPLLLAEAEWDALRRGCLAVA
jgi:hypothetical protein